MGMIAWSPSTYKRFCTFFFSGFPSHPSTSPYPPLPLHYSSTPNFGLRRLLYHIESCTTFSHPSALVSRNNSCPLEKMRTEQPSLTSPLPHKWIYLPLPSVCNSGRHGPCSLLLVLLCFSSAALFGSSG